MSKRKGAYYVLTYARYAHAWRVASKPYRRSDYARRCCDRLNLDGQRTRLIRAASEEDAVRVINERHKGGATMPDLFNNGEGAICPSCYGPMRIGGARGHGRGGCMSVRAPWPQFRVERALMALLNGHEGAESVAFSTLLAVGYPVELLVKPCAP